MTTIHKYQEYIATETRRFFHKTGLYTATKPYTTIASSLLVCTALISCVLFLGRYEVRYDYRDAPRKSQYFKTYDEILVETFGDVMGRPADMIVELDPKGNILEKENMLKAMEVHLQILTLTANRDDSSEDGGTFGFSDVCLPRYTDGPCAFDSPFERLGLTYEKVQNMTQAELNDEFAAGAERDELSLNLVVGGLEVETDYEGKLVSVAGKSLRFVHYTSFPVERDSRKIYDMISGTVEARKADVLLWEQSFLDYLCTGSDNQQNDACPSHTDNLLITATAERSLFDELDRNATASSPLMALALFLILLIMWFMIGGKPFRKSRLGLGVGALFTIMLSMGAGFGLVSLFQIHITDISLILVFVVVGIGVDDVIVVVDFVVRQKDKHTPLVERIALGLGRAGPTIFLTSLTNLIAFFVAGIIDYPGVKWFCSAAGIILFILFLLTVTLFTALLTLDERRLEMGRYDCLCCKSYAQSSSPSSSSYDLSTSKEGTTMDQGQIIDNPPIVQEKKDDPSGRMATLVQTLNAHYLKLISNKAFASIIVVGFTSLIPIGFAFAAPNLPVEVKFEAYFPDNSYYTDYRRIVEDNFATLGVPAFTIFESIDVSDPIARDQAVSLLKDIDEEDFIIKPHTSWLVDYDAYVNDYNSSMVSSDDTLPLSGEAYYNGLENFLQITDLQCVQKREDGCDRSIVPASYTNDITFSRYPNGTIQNVAVTRFICTIKDFDTLTPKIINMEAHQEKLATSLKLYDSLDENDVLIFSPFYMFHERDGKMTTLLTKTLLFAALAVLGTLMFFLHPVSVLIIAFSIASIDGALFVVMYMWGIAIDVVAFLVLAMSIGLSVDYVVHVAHAFEHENGTPSVRLQNALSGIGMSVAKGGVSTFVGISALAFAPSPIYRTFFKLIFSTVILGLFAGLVFFPACTILIGHRISPKKVKVSE